MNLVIFSAQYLPTVGGIERYTNSLSRKLIEKGHRITVVTSSLPNLPDHEIHEDGIEVYRIPVKWIMNRRFSIPIPGGKFRQIEKQLSSKNFDFAIIQTKFYLNSVWASRFCKKNGISAIVVEHGTAHLIRDGLVGFIGKTYEHIAARYIHHNCKNFYGVSMACCGWLEHFGLKGKGCLYNAVDPAVVADTAEKGSETLCEKIAFENKTTIAFAGRFIKEKGVVNLANAFKEINKEFSNVQLVMAGDGELWQQVKDMGVENLILPGNLSYPHSLALLKNSDIFCLPTFSEGFSTSVLEAAALKAMIITTKTGGSPQLIKDENYGILIDSMESADIVKALRKALSDKEYTRKCAENAYESLISHFTWERVAEDFLDIYNRHK
ncbi:MAG: glycosyltransferase family 4 protein [Oscillospiraceae bacterium]|nr:glycosyltransferase family 4 protein [Oscillospiraceae bacterium]